MKLKSTKRKFNAALNPIKVLLIKKKEELDHAQWLAFVQTTREHILFNPSEYLGSDLPTHEELKNIVGEIFLDFLAMENIKSKRHTQPPYLRNF